MPAKTFSAWKFTHVVQNRPARSKSTIQRWYFYESKQKYRTNSNCCQKTSFYFIYTQRTPSQSSQQITSSTLSPTFTHSTTCFKKRCSESRILRCVLWGDLCTLTSLSTSWTDISGTEKLRSRKLAALSSACLAFAVSIPR